MRLLSPHHLKEQRLSYLQHLRRALRIGTLMTFSGIICLIHAVCPFVFANAASKTIKKLYYEI